MIGAIVADAARASARAAPARKAAAEQKAQDKTEAAAAAALAEAEQQAAAHLAERLDESVRAAGRYLWLSPATLDAIVLAAGASHVTDVRTFASTFRVLFVADRENAGKTTGMQVGLSLSYSPMNLAGDTTYGVKSGIFEAASAGLPCPTFYYDEVTKVFGVDGSNGDSNPIADILKRGYKAYEVANKPTVISRSRNGVREEASIFAPAWMTGRKLAIPRDLRSRTIVINMKPAPEGAVEYFDPRDAMETFGELSESLGYAVRGNRDIIRKFRVRTVGRRDLVGTRKGEVWEPLFAVASAACPRDEDGNITDSTWLNRAMAAYTELAADLADEVKLSPEQVLVRDIADAAQRLADAGEIFEHSGRTFVRAGAVRDEIRHIDPRRYSGPTDSQLARRGSDALGFGVTEVRHAGKTVKGWYAEELENAWQRMAPQPPADVTLHDEDDPWS